MYRTHSSFVSEGYVNQCMESKYHSADKQTQKCRDKEYEHQNTKVNTINNKLFFRTKKKVDHKRGEKKNQTNKK